MDLLVVVALFALQALLVAPLFTGDFTRYRGSIEAAYISDARFIVDHFPDLSWNQLWYLGFPFEWFYTPLLPALVALLGRLIGDVPAAYRIVAASGFALGPAALYFAAREPGAPTSPRCRWRSRLPHRAPARSGSAAVRA